MLVARCEHVLKQSFQFVVIFAKIHHCLECLEGVALNYIDSMHQVHGNRKSGSLGVRAKSVIPPFRPAVSVFHAKSSTFGFGF